MTDVAEAKGASVPGDGAAMDMGRQALDQWARGMFDYGNELGRFAVARFNQQMEACREFANCRSVGDAVTCEWNFLQKAWTDYSEQANKQLRFWMTLVEDVMAIGPAVAAIGRPSPIEEKTWKVAPSAAAPAPGRHPSAHADKAPAGQSAAP